GDRRIYRISVRDGDALRSREYASCHPAHRPFLGFPSVFRSPSASGAPTLSTSAAGGAGASSIGVCPAFFSRSVRAGSSGASKTPLTISALRLKAKLIHPRFMVLCFHLIGTTSDLVVGEVLPPLAAGAVDDTVVVAHHPLVGESAAAEGEDERRRERRDDVRPLVEDEYVPLVAWGKPAAPVCLGLDVVARDDRDAPDCEPLGTVVDLPLPDLGPTVDVDLVVELIMDVVGRADDQILRVDVVPLTEVFYL